jgi:hypothetical protein
MATFWALRKFTLGELGKSLFCVLAEVRKAYSRALAKFHQRAK